MKNPWMLTTIALCAILALVAVVPNLTADEDEDEDDDDGAATATKIAAAVKNVPVSLVQAVTAAETATSGKAIAAEIDVEEDAVTYEVVVLVEKEGAVFLHEVEVDAKSGKILETEQIYPRADDDDDDDDEGDDDGDDDDDGEDDD